MSYTPINWQTGDTITAEKLNKMDNGWGVSSTQLFSETVTTASETPGDELAFGSLVYSEPITADILAVTFGGVEYTCPKQEAIVGGCAYGADALDPITIDFSDVPFLILSSPNGDNLVITEMAGTYEISVEASSVETSASFQTAVNSVVDTSTMPMLCVSGTTTHDDMASAMMRGRILFFQPYGSMNANIIIITSVGDDSVTFFPTDSSIRTSFVNGVFVVSYA